MHSKPRTFDAKTFLAQTGSGRTVLQYPKNKVIFAQGQSCDAVFYIQKGRTKLTVLSTRGKEATIALLGPGDFMGEGCITSDQPVCPSFATTVTDCCVLRIEKEAMMRDFTMSNRSQTYLLLISLHLSRYPLQSNPGSLN